MKKGFLTGLLFSLMASTAQAESIYVAFKWAAPGAKSFTESWVILDTKYNTGTTMGMQLLSEELAQLKKTKTVVIYYVRELEGEDSPRKEISGDIEV